jgi:prohibitin 2
MSAPDPKEAWARIQNELTRRSQRFGGSGGGPPKGLFGGIGGILLIGGGIWAANNALFNGAYTPIWKSYEASLVV